MGFNKCYLTKEKIKKIYESDGFESTKRWFHIYDAYITDETSSILLDLYKNGDFSEELLNIYLYEKVKNTERV